MTIGVGINCTIDLHTGGFRLKGYLMRGFPGNQETMELRLCIIV